MEGIPAKTKAAPMATVLYALIILSAPLNLYYQVTVLFNMGAAYSMMECTVLISTCLLLALGSPIYFFVIANQLSHYFCHILYNLLFHRRFQIFSKFSRLFAAITSSSFASMTHFGLLYCFSSSSRSTEKVLTATLYLIQ